MKQPILNYFISPSDGNSLPGQPVIGVEDEIEVAEALTPYRFQVNI